MGIAMVRSSQYRAGSASIRGSGARPAEPYDRMRQMQDLLRLAPEELRGDEVLLARRLCRLLARALRAERNRCRAGHHGYDLDRHLALARALKAERAVLRAYEKGATRMDRTFCR